MSPNGRLHPKTLFRQEAVDARRDSWLGRIQVATPLSRWFFASLALAFAASLFALLVFGHYTRRERVRGRLVPSRGVVRARASAPGVVKAVLVHEGQLVESGQPLMEISGEQDSAALGSTRARISEQLRVKRSRLKADIATRAHRASEETAVLRARLALAHEQEAQIVAGLKPQKMEAKKVGALLSHLRRLREEGYVSALDVQKQETEVLAIRAQTKKLELQRLGIRDRIKEIEQQLAQLPLDLEIARNESERELADIEEQLAQNEAQRTRVLRSSEPGLVASVLIKRGQAVVSGQSLVSVLPKGSVLEAQLLVPSRAIGFIESGSRVVLRYDAYPYQKFGQQYGRVDDISHNALGPPEVAALTGERAREPLYQVSVKLDRQDILAYGRSETLKAGMALDADILMERRRLIEWIFEPLYGLEHRFASQQEVTHG